MIKLVSQKNYFITLKEEQDTFFSNPSLVYYFPSDVSQGLLIQKEKDFLKSILQDKKALSESLLGLERNALVTLLYLHYLIHTSQYDDIYQVLSKASAYAYIRLYLNTLKCHPIKENVEHNQESMGILLALVFLTSKHSLSKLLDTDNFPIKIQAPLAFMMSLILIDSTDTVETKKVRYTFYDKTLKEWNSQNIQWVKMQIDILCDAHLEYSRVHSYYSTINTELFPYEILTWLKLRERAGLKNPKTFTHPLMNTPIAKMFLDIKEPLPYPKELPYAKELLEKLKEKCPDVEIPEWINGVDSSSETKEASTPSPNNQTIPDDFMK